MISVSKTIPMKGTKAEVDNRWNSQANEKETRYGMEQYVGCKAKH